MAIPKFVVTAGPDGLNALMDLDVDGELDVHPLAGVTGRFTANLKPGLYPVGDGMYLIEPIDFTVDTDGKINGDSGVELLAQVDGIGNLQWSISFDRAYLNGKLLELPEWPFPAGAEGETLRLETLLSVRQRPSNPMWLGIGPRGYSVVAGEFNEDGALVLENADGSQTSAITPADGTLIIVDNGGSVSIG